MSSKKIKAIDVNCDTGESYGYEKDDDEGLFSIITSANVACGFHAGDPLRMDKTVRLCKDNGVQIGAHPGYPDPMGFGRRDMEITPEEIGLYLLYQWGALEQIARASGMVVKHIKLHGALYNKAARDELLSREIFRLLERIDIDVVLVCPFGSTMYDLAMEYEIRVAGEVYADRAYLRDGSLAPRGTTGAVIADPDKIAERTLEIIRGEIKTLEGFIYKVKADTICIHSDTKGAFGLAEKITKTILEQGISLLPLDKII
ncbi:MAG: LamB/YcsF family protein [Peptococcaceae bacterium]|nr:LamB/YcsF family protein [Peptococcaceae bacterium]